MYGEYVWEMLPLLGDRRCMSREDRLLAWTTPRLHRLNVGDYTVFHYGKFLKGVEITEFLVEITQVECWRLHSVSLWGIP